MFLIGYKTKLLNLKGLIGRLATEKYADVKLKTESERGMERETDRDGTYFSNGKRQIPNVAYDLTLKRDTIPPSQTLRLPSTNIYSAFFRTINSPSAYDLLQ